MLKDTIKKLEVFCKLFKFSTLHYLWQSFNQICIQMFYLFFVPFRWLMKSGERKHGQVSNLFSIISCINLMYLKYIPIKFQSVDEGCFKYISAQAQYFSVFNIFRLLLEGGLGSHFVKCKPNYFECLEKFEIACFLNRLTLDEKNEIFNAIPFSEKKFMEILMYFIYNYRIKKTGDVFWIIFSLTWW